MDRKFVSYKTSKRNVSNLYSPNFQKAIIEYNDEEREIKRIKFNPWEKITIPKSDNGVQRAISAEACREFFNRPLPETKMISSLPELARDVSLLSLCLGGINTVDLYELKRRIIRMVLSVTNGQRPATAAGTKRILKCVSSRSSSPHLTNTSPMMRTRNTCSIFTKVQ